MTLQSEDKIKLAREIAKAGEQWFNFKGADGTKVGQLRAMENPDELLVSAQKGDVASIIALDLLIATHSLRDKPMPLALKTFTILKAQARIISRKTGNAQIDRDENAKAVFRTAREIIRKTEEIENEKKLPLYGKQDAANSEGSILNIIADAFGITPAKARKLYGLGQDLLT